VEVLDYHLPAEAIAQVPAEPRDSARLLDALDPSGRLSHRHVRDLPDLTRPGDVVVVNDTRVMPARLLLSKPTGGAAEVLLLDGAGEEWAALVRPGRRLPPGTRLAPREGGAAVVEVGERLDEGRRRVRLLAPAGEVLAAHGQVALPPYVTAPLADSERYQTVYARRPGSVAAPTAGLHLTEHVLRRLEEQGTKVWALDLAVGLATFKPIVSERAEDHAMHREHYSVPAATWQACKAATRVIAVGTTTVRALETVAMTGRLEGESDLYIRPGFTFSVVDVMLTNFHMPRSTLLLMLEAFMGPRWRDVYDAALAAGYRFLSFGDAMIASRR
jgi:S-adenosylmethionine:tRNA ribosyltransferase-isomerase